MSKLPFEKEISVDTRFPEWDGMLTVVFNGESSVERKRIDLIPEIKNIEDSLEPGEESGTAFGNAVRRYVWQKHGIKISVTAAMRYYNDLCQSASEINDFFYPTSNSPTTSEADSTVDPSPEASPVSGTVSSKKSKRKNRSKSSKTPKPTTSPESTT